MSAANLAKVVRVDRWRQSIDFLPSVEIQDFALPDDDTDVPNVDDDRNQRQVLDRLQDIQERVTGVSEQDHATELAGLRNALSTLSSQLERQLASVGALTGNRVGVLQSRIEKLAGFVNVLIWLAGATLLFVIFK